MIITDWASPTLEPVTLDNVVTHKHKRRFTLTIEQFLEKALSHHADKGFDYSLVELDEGANSKIVISCPLHGPFIQMASAHMRGTSCPECGLLKRGKNKMKEMPLLEEIREWLFIERENKEIEARVNDHISAFLYNGAETPADRSKRMQKLIKVSYNPRGSYGTF